MHDLVLANGRIVTPAGEVFSSVAVDEGRISAIGPLDEMGAARRQIELGERVLLPGLFDPHVHFGLGDEIDDDTMLEDFRHNSKDCLVGGVTSIATTTLIAAPSIVELFSRARRCAEGHSYCDYKFTTVITNRDQVAEIPRVVSEGGVSFKFFTGYVGAQAEGFGMNPEGIPPDFFAAACDAIRRAGAPVFPAIHAEEPTLRGVLIDRLRSQGRAGTLRAWAETSPEWAESVQVFTYGLIAHDAGVAVYPVHVSSKFTVDTIRRMHSQGIRIVGETLALFLCTTADEMDKHNMGPKAKIQPPIRHQEDREALWSAIEDRTISVVGTDSLTYSAKYKEGVDFWDCRVGVNLQVADTLALMWSEGVGSGRISPLALCEVLSTNAAKRYGLYPRKGAIVLGADADLVVVDPDLKLTLGVDRYRGKSDYSIWEGREVVGGPVMTILHGQVVAESGEIVADVPDGRHLNYVVGRGV